MSEKIVPCPREGYRFRITPNSYDDLPEVILEFKRDGKWSRWTTVESLGTWHLQNKFGDDVKTNVEYLMDFMWEKEMERMDFNITLRDYWEDENVHSGFTVGAAALEAAK